MNTNGYKCILADIEAKLPPAPLYTKSERLAMVWFLVEGHKAGTLSPHQHEIARRIIAILMEQKDKEDK